MKDLRVSNVQFLAREGPKTGCEKALGDNEGHGKMLRMEVVVL